MIVAAVSFFAYLTVTPRGVPVKVEPVSEYVVILHALPGIPLPDGFKDGDRFDVRKQNFATRAAIIAVALPVGYAVDAVIDRGDATLTIPAKVVSYRGLNKPGQPGRVHWNQWLGIGVFFLLGAIALLLLWRGRDRTALGMTLWAVTIVLSAGATDIPAAGWAGLTTMFLAIALYLTARIGFYVMIEAGLARSMSAGWRMVFRVIFVILLTLGALQAFGAQIVRLVTGSSEFMASQYGLILTASYIVPIVMLVMAYPSTAFGERVRARWMLASGIAWVANILLQNSPLLGNIVSGLFIPVLQAAALTGFLYAVLKYRVVDIAVVIDRALVYGLVTSLVIGIISAVNELVLHETLTRGAGLTLQLVVALALGIVLGRVRRYAKLVVDRVFFRSKYHADTALKTFARRVGHIENTSRLLETAVSEISRHTDAPGVAMYARQNGVWQRIRKTGEVGFPAQLENDDAALVAIRTEQAPVDLAGTASELGEEACMFPMLVLGELQGAIVCANRPGEHYSKDEKTLLLEVSNAIGTAWRILIGRDNEAYVRVMATGELTPEIAREKARTLMAA